MPSVAAELPLLTSRIPRQPPGRPPARESRAPHRDSPLGAVFEESRASYLASSRCCAHEPPQQQHHTEGQGAQSRSSPRSRSPDAPLRRRRSGPGALPLPGYAKRRPLPLETPDEPDHVRFAPTAKPELDLVSPRYWRNQHRLASTSSPPDRLPAEHSSQPEDLPKPTQRSGPRSCPPPAEFSSSCLVSSRVAFLSL